MKKIILIIFFSSPWFVLHAQQNNKTGAGTITQANKNTVYLTPGIVTVTKDVVTTSDADKMKENYPGYHTTVVSDISVSSEKKINVIEVSNDVNQKPDKNIANKKEVTSETDKANTKQKSESVFKPVIKPN